MKPSISRHTHSKKTKKSLAQIEELFQKGLLSLEEYNRRKEFIVNENSKG